MANDTSAINPSVTTAKTHPPSAVLVLGAPTAGVLPMAALIRHANAVEVKHGQTDPNVAVAEFSAHVLKEFGSAWNDSSQPMVPRCDPQESAVLIRGAIEERFLADAIALLQQHSQPVLVLSDHAVCLLSWFWLKALKAAGFTTRVVAVTRKPIEVAQAMQQRFALNQPRSLRLWAKHTIAALDACLAEPAWLIVPFDHLFDASQVAHLATAVFVGQRRPTPSDDAIGTVIDPSRRTRTAAPDALATAVVLPSLVRRLHAATGGWARMTANERTEAVLELRAAFADYSMFAGTVTMVRLPREQVARLPRVMANPVRGTRKLLLHYHLFKNAGTSVDTILRRNFGDRWLNTEFDGKPAAQHQAEIRGFIQDHPDLLAISSHTMMLPPPTLEGVEIFPIIFVRHPIDRLRSAYEFQRQQPGDTVDVKLAKQHDFAGYLRARLAHASDRACRDFQTARLAMCVPAATGTEQQRSRTALDTLPFVGLVEAFQASIQRLQDQVQPLFPGFRGFQVWQNSTRSREGVLERRLADIRHELGDQLYNVVVMANQNDLELHRLVTERYAHT